MALLFTLSLTWGAGTANAVNSSGVAVGWHSYGNDNHAVIYDHGKITDIGTLGGVGSVAYDINDNGDVVGWANTNTGAMDAFLYRNGVMTDLGNGEALGINASGQIVGINNNGAFLYSGGVMKSLGGGNSCAESINDNGQITGQAYIAGAYQVFLYNNGQMTGLGSGDGVSINNSGQIVGYDGYLYANGTITNLGLSSASCINNFGEVVGGSYVYNNGKITNLNNLVNGWLIWHCNGVNDNGQIVGWGQLKNGNGQNEAFLLTPTPEPSSLTLMIVAVAIFGVRKYRHRN